MVGVNKRWRFLIFDVTTAFLSGKEVDRELVIKAPPEGLPECPEFGWPAIKPFELLKVCKSAYGLSEAPRLWYLRARELLISIGFEELSMAKATFIMKKEGEVVCILCLHVDDGLLVIKPSEVKKNPNCHQQTFQHQGMARGWRKGRDFPRREDLCKEWRVL